MKGSYHLQKKHFSERRNIGKKIKNFSFICALSFLLLLSTHISLTLFAEEGETSLLIGETRFEVGYVTGKFIGLKQDYVELGAFAPLFSTGEFLTFADVKGYRFDNSKWGASSGVGLRTWSFDEYILGTNVYYDFLQGFYHNFNRIGVGLEFLSSRFDVRLNGYLPILHDEQHSKTIYFEDYQGNNFGSYHYSQYAPRGAFDMELGVPVACWNDFSSYFAVGPYYYNWRNQDNYWGGQARLELYWKSFVSFQVQTSYDRVNRSQTEGKFLFSFPLDFFFDGKSCEDYCKTLFYQPVIRNGTIFTERCCNYTWNWD